MNWVKEKTLRAQHQEKVLVSYCGSVKGSLFLEICG